MYKHTNKMHGILKIITPRVKNSKFLAFLTNTHILQHTPLSSLYCAHSNHIYPYTTCMSVTDSNCNILSHYRELHVMTFIKRRL